MKAESLTNLKKSLVNLLSSGFLLVIVALCLISSYLFLNTESLITLLVFDFLFLTLTFHLWGKMVGKLGLLALGNAVGLFCNLVFYSIHIMGVALFGDGFKVFYAISYPILNLLWVVSFWSLSLAALPKPQCARQVEKPQ